MAGRGLPGQRLSNDVIYLRPLPLFSSLHHSPIHSINTRSTNFANCLSFSLSREPSNPPLSNRLFVRPKSDCSSLFPLETNSSSNPLDKSSSISSPNKSNDEKSFNHLERPVNTQSFRKPVQEFSSGRLFPSIRFVIRSLSDT